MTLFLLGLLCGVGVMFFWFRRALERMADELEPILAVMEKALPPAPQLSRVTLMEIVEAMEADDEFDEDAPTVTH